MNDELRRGSRIARATEQDVAVILSLIRGLADYAQRSVEATATEACLRGSADCLGRRRGRRLRRVLPELLDVPRPFRDLPRGPVRAAGMAPARSRPAAAGRGRSTRRRTQLRAPRMGGARLERAGAEV